MPELASSLKKPAKNRGKDSRNGRSPKGHGGAFLLIALVACLLGAAFIVGGERALSLLPQDLNLRNVLLWLNPAFSALRMDELPFFQGHGSDKTKTAFLGEDNNPSETQGFPNHENPYCESARTGASQEISVMESSVGLQLDALAPSGVTGHDAVSVSEKPKAIDTSITRIAQAGPVAPDMQPKQQPAPKTPGPPSSQGTGQETPPGSEKEKSQQEPTAQKAPADNSLRDQRVQDPGSVQKTSGAGKKDTPDWEAETRSEQFQLPGSIMVKIQGYSGNTVNWDLAVVLDDSDSMGRQSKAWNPSRFKTALTFIEKLPSALSSGSRLAVRDFACGSPDEKKAAKKVCLSHMLMDWTNMPAKQLKDRLEKADLGGATDPCAAAAFSIKKDFQGGAGRKPRLLIVTGGASTICSVSAVTRAMETSDATKGTIIDVLALGINKKRQKGYSVLTSRTGGVFIEAERPADLDQPFSRYSKILQAKHFEKVEIRGDKASLSVAPFQEITVAPGTYTVSLPVVEGIDPSKRTIPNVKISSGEAHILDVSIKKGKPVIKTVKK